MNFEADKNQQRLFRKIYQLIGIIGLLLLAIVTLLFVLFCGPPNHTQKNTSTSSPSEKTVTYWIAPNESALSDNTAKEMILYGRDIIQHTSTYFGPKGTVSKNATNGMNCQNCHLDAGTKIFGNNYGAVAATYPKYRARSGAVEDIYKRINDCFERSLNGKPLAQQSTEMQAIAAYINWLGANVPKGEKPQGSGFKDINFLDRAANPQKGKIVYMQYCKTCHQENGEGLLNKNKTAYTYPPLWGANSYNDGAGLFRISNFAKYAKYNMPLGVNYTAPKLSDEEAWDVAAFVNSQPRPTKDIRKDWPKIEEKPFDHPFGKYADGFSEEQHKYGPFQLIKAKLEQLKSKKS